MILIGLGLWVFTAALCIGEIICEKDWPRHTWPFCAIMTLGLLLSTIS
jgi:hypothetical protein